MTPFELLLNDVGFFRLERVPPAPCTHGPGCAYTAWQDAWSLGLTHPRTAWTEWGSAPTLVVLVVVVLVSLTERTG